MVSRWVAWVLRQSLLLRMTLLLLVPAAGIAVVAHSFSLGELCLTVVLLGLWGLLGRRSASTRKEPADVETLFRDSR